MHRITTVERASNACRVGEHLREVFHHASGYAPMLFGAERCQLAVTATGSHLYALKLGEQLAQPREVSL